MDIRKDRDFALYVNQKNGETREFLISLDEVLLIVAGLGKAVTVSFTDTVGEVWNINLCHLSADVNMEAKRMTLTC